MADIELIIKLPEEVWEYVKNGIPLGVSEYVKNGTPLPKGHGKIVDVDTIDLNQDEFISQSDYYAAECAIENAPIIIEADTESEVNVC